jgi:hypothetical protein
MVDYTDSLICCVANLVLQGGVKSERRQPFGHKKKLAADGKAFLCSRRL